MPAPLLEAWPKLAQRIAPARLGDFPTPVERLARIETHVSAGPLYVKRDDLSSPIYGGNKVRTLEMLFGVAQAKGHTEITAVGAYGSNHAVATALHAPRVGLSPNALLFPQPASAAALENLVVTSARARRCVPLLHWSSVPFAIWRARKEGAFVMPPGGAVPEGALGYVSAALELCKQVAEGVLPVPAAVVVGVGSCCTTAGLVLGSVLAARLGLVRAPLTIRAVRVSPWPITSRTRILGLAVATSKLLARLAERAELAVTRRELGAYLEIDGRELGAGYGLPTPRGLEAIELFRREAGLTLDTTYSAKSAAGFLRRARELREGPLVFWSTKSSAPLPVISQEQAAHAPQRLRSYLRDAEKTLG
jgi:D-cysteine desulfhydrase